MKTQPIEYELIETGKGFCLTIWEPDARGHYRFMANYTVKDAFEAETILRQFLRSNR